MWSKRLGHAGRHRSFSEYALARADELDFVASHKPPTQTASSSATLRHNHELVLQVARALARCDGGRSVMCSESLIDPRPPSTSIPSERSNQLGINVDQDVTAHLFASGFFL